MLINVAFPGDRNVIKKDAEKIFIYKDLIIEIHRMWNLQAKEMPVITGANGTVSESLRQYLSNTPGKLKLRNYKKKPYWALHTYYVKC